MLRLLPLLFILVFQSAKAEVNAYLNRYSINADDTVRLTIEATQSGVVQRPDMSPLSSDFSILGSKKFTISNSRSGSRQATTRWQVLLRPKRAGEITIPALTINGESSLPVTLQVSGYIPQPAKPQQPFNTNNISSANEAGPTVSYSSNYSVRRPLFLQNKLDFNEAYTGSQLIYTTELYHKEPLGKNAVVNEPFLDQALIIAMDQPTTITKQVRGEEYSVTRQNYLIFPDKPGSHVMEAPVFAGTTIDGTYYETQGTPTEMIILPQANDNAHGYWLPSLKLTLDDQVDQEKGLEAGDTITRTLTISVQGVPAARIPPLSVLKNELATLKLVDVQLDESFDEKGIISTRTETIEITFLERGETTLPPIDIHWWDIYEDRAQVASLPPRIFHISPATKTSETKGQASSTDQSKTLLSPESAEESPIDVNSELIPLISLLLAVSIISSIGWLYTYRKLKRVKAHQVKKREASSSKQRRKKEHNHSLAEVNTYQALAMACQQNDAEIAKLRLVEWAQRFWADYNINNAEDICSAAKNQTLDFLIIDLEQHLYSNKQDKWQGDLLLQAIDTLRRRKSVSEQP